MFVLSKPRSRGFTLLEVVVAVLMMTAAMALAVRALGWVAAERRAAERRQRAVVEAANALDYLAARPWEELTPEALRSTTLSPEARQALSGAELRVAVADESPLKRVTVEVLWPNRYGDREAPVRLTTWLSRHGRSAP